jgi:hypothetical protein
MGGWRPLLATWGGWPPHIARPLGVDEVKPPPTGPWGGLGHPKGQAVALRGGLAPQGLNQTKNKIIFFIILFLK